jgi:hypothetical protein
MFVDAVGKRFSRYVINSSFLVQLLPGSGLQRFAATSRAV